MSADQVNRSGTVADIPDADLVERAVRSAVHNGRRRDPNWERVRGGFGLGSTFSAQLCKRFGIDPEGSGL